MDQSLGILPTTWCNIGKNNLTLFLDPDSLSNNGQCAEHIENSYLQNFAYFILAQRRVLPYNFENRICRVVVSLIECLIYCFEKFNQFHYIKGVYSRRIYLILKMRGDAPNWMIDNLIWILHLFVANCARD